MFSLFRRNSRIQVVGAPADASVTADLNLAPVHQQTLSVAAEFESSIGMSRVFREERRYWVNVAIRLVVSFLVAALTVFAYWALTLTFGRGVPIWGPIGLDTEAATTALGLLATVVIALQVSVRTPISTENPNQALARQLALESVSNIAAAAAFGIFFAVAVTLKNPNLADDAGFLSLIFAAATVLAGLAADAGAASSIKFGSRIYKARELAEHTRLRALLLARNRSAPHPLSVSDTLRQLLLIVVVGSAVNAALYAAILAPTVDFLVWAAIYLLCLVASILLLGLATLARALIAIGQNLFGIYVLSITSIAAITVAVAAIGSNVRGQSGYVDWLVLCEVSLVLGVSVVQVLLWTGLIPWRQRTAIRGVGFELSTRWLASRVRATHPRERLQREAFPKNPSPASIGVLLLSVFFGPAGALLSLTVLRLPDTNKATRFVGVLGLWIGSLVSLALVAVVVLASAGLF